MNNGQKSLSINETFIVEGLEGDVLSACTGFFTNALVSCTGNTQILLGVNIIEANSAFSATTFYGDGSNLTGVSKQDTFVTGGTYNPNSGVAIFTNNTGGTFSLTGFYTGATDVFVTGVTFSDNTLTLYRNDGVVFGATIDNFISLNVNGPVSATTFYGDGSNLTGVSKQDTFVTGGTYSNGTTIFTNNTGGTFSLTGFYTGFTGGVVSGLTATTISATTYQNLPTDIRVTGGTYFDGVTTFTNNTGGTFTIDGPSNYNAGIIFGAENWVDNNNGSIDLPEIKVALYDNPNNLELLKIYIVASGTTGIGGIPALANNDTNYIIVEYNGGSPRYNVLDNDGTVNNSDVVLYMIVYRANNFVHTLEFGDMGAGLPNKLNTRLISTDRFARESGCALGLSGSTGIVTLSSGVVWNGPYRQIVTAVNSQDDIFFKSFHSGGTWVYNTTGNTINNDYYDNGTDLVLATAGKYLVNWYFRGQEVNDHLYELISYGEFDTIQLAEASPEPNLPELITSHAFLVGRIIVEVSATTGITQSAFNTVFQPSGAPVLHNDLAGIQGGVAGEYYHLDSNKYNNLALTNTDNNFSVGQSFNDGLTATTISATTYQNLPIKYYAEYSVPPTIPPIASGVESISIGNGALAESDYMFVVGNLAGSGANNAGGSNFLGVNAGFNATNAYYSNFLGFFAGINASNAAQSNFFGQNAGLNAVNATFSNFMGYNAGQEASEANNSNFLGTESGFQANNANNSNFFGDRAGYQAIDANNSNFLGTTAGYQASSSEYSNFMGYEAGLRATKASASNFMGQQAGADATDANNSNFLGASAGLQATNANNSNFLGTESGFQANKANNSNFMGQAAGYVAIDANNSNFFGSSAGYQATTAANSNFMGQNAGRSATDANNSNFFGSSAGADATDANNSNFLGNQAGRGATGARYSNFMGANAGESAINARFSNFMGVSAGLAATNANSSNFLGLYAGDGATDADNSNFLGASAGLQATNANSSNFMGNQAGLQATFANNSNFFGTFAGRDATNASNSNFLGQQAGQNATNANNSNFLGFNAGSGATNANTSNFLGPNAGRGATNAENSNFFGSGAGSQATSAFFSNFLGNSAGNGATNARNSNFFGQNAGLNAIDARHSTLIGFQAGFATSSGNSIGSNNIIIGTNITLPVSTTNSINIGGVLFGSGTYSTITGNPSLTAQTNGRIGINIVSPQQALHVSGNTLIQGGLTANTISATTYQNLPIDIRVTGASYNNNTFTFTNNTGGTFNILFNTVSGLTVNGNLTVTGNTSLRGVSATTISATTYQNLPTDIRVTGATYVNNTFTFTNNTGGTFNVLFNRVSGLTATTISAATYQNLPLGSIATSGTTLYSTSPSTSSFSTSNSIFLGLNAGRNAGSASNSNFLGQNAGSGATSALNSNFMGQFAGQGATSASGSNFFGFSAGFQATDASGSNFMGYNAGFNAINAAQSNFLGSNAGENATNAIFSNFLGAGAGLDAINSSNSNFFGQNAGLNAFNAGNSNFLGNNAGYQAQNADNSNFIGASAGENATVARFSNFFGANAGLLSTFGSNSNFFGQNAGVNATNASNSNFLGYQSGRDAINATYSNFMGDNAGLAATNANSSNFFGTSAGDSATDANNSNFFGQGAGLQATNANNSNFLGQGAGKGAINSSYSNFFGFQAGSDSGLGGNIGSNNIIIGTNITLPPNTVDSINIGGVLFGSGTYGTTTGNPSTSATANGRIGINVPVPQQALHVSGNTLIQGGLTANTISATTYNGYTPASIDDSIINALIFG